MNSWKVYKKCDDYRVSAPRSVQDLIEIKSIAENGIFEVGGGGIFTKTYKVRDINYETASPAGKKQIREAWCDILNSQLSPFELTWNNKNRSAERLSSEVLLPDAEDGMDRFRGAMNEEIEEKLQTGRKGIEQELYITLRYDRSSSYDDARLYFETTENALAGSFADIGSELTALNADDRLHVLHDMYRFGHEDDFCFNFRQAVSSGWDFIDQTACSCLDFSHKDYIQLDDKYAQCLYFKDYKASSIDERFLTNIMALNIKMMGSISCVPIPDAAVKDLLKNKYMGIEGRIRTQNKNHVKDMNFASDISLAVIEEKETIKKLITENMDEDQGFFNVMILIMVVSDSLPELKENVALITETAKSGGSVLVDTAYFRQREAMNTILPLGLRQTEYSRNFTTRSLSAFFMFRTQELYMRGGNYCGTNTISKNLVTVNRKKLLNPHGFIFGVTGSGKTTACKLDILQTRCRTDDDIIVIDPKNDYERITAALSGAYVNISTLSPNRYNPLETLFADRDIAADKIDIVLAIVETCKREPLTPAESNIIDRALKFAVTEAELQGRQACLTDVYGALEKMNEQAAKDVMNYMGLFVTGSLGIFAKQSNVSIVDNRLVVFGLRDMGTKLRDLTMLVMLECVLERIKSNAAYGKCTWLFIDEFHELLHTEYQQEFVKKLWMLVRSLKGICTGLTQNVSDLCINETTKTMLDNSEFLVIMKQRDGAKDTLRDSLGLSDELIKYTTRESRPGRGLIRAGNVTVPFDLSVDDESELYELGIIERPAHDVRAS